MARVRDIPKMKINFEKMIAQGEMSGVDGFRAETPNGTAHWKGKGWNANGRGGWAAQSPGGWTDIENDPTRPSGRSNRTGE